MKTLIIIGIIISATIASAQTRDSTASYDSTATAVSLSMSFTAEESAALHRIFGVAWRQELRSHINHVITSRDPERENIKMWESINRSKLKAADKVALLNELGLRDPKVIQKQKIIKVPE